MKGKYTKPGNALELTAIYPLLAGLLEGLWGSSTALIQQYNAAMQLLSASGLLEQFPIQNMQRPLSELSETCRQLVPQLTSLLTFMQYAEMQSGPKSPSPFPTEFPPTKFVN